MQIEPGQKLLHYRLDEKIGEGGMGVVWRALDTSLDRDVAIKILPESMSDEAERLQRFEREAKLLASIQHPNIAVVHGLHEVDGGRFLAMELVPGQDLEVRLSQGRIALDDLLRIAHPIADALEAAHEQGVVHRDLKPANVVVAPDGVVKVLDFGLAKSLDATPNDVDLINSPTLTSAGTMAGVILGTAGYMAPEQAKGQMVDRRADIWAFGVLLYEMITGTRLYDESTVSEALAAVLLKEPEWDRLPDDTPRALETLVRRCLTKDPRARLRDMGEARITLENLIQGTDESRLSEAAPAKESNRRSAILSAAGLAVGILLGRLLFSGGASPESQDPLSLSINPPESVNSMTNPAIHPDGNWIVYRGLGGGETHFYRRDLATGLTERMPGTEGANHPVFSPDGNWLAFAGNGIQKIATNGGDPLAVFDGVSSGIPGIAWLEDDSILFSDWLTGFQRVSANGGSAEVVTDPDAASGEIGHWWPYPLPGGRYVLFTVWLNGAGLNDANIAALDLTDYTWSTLFPGARAEFAAPDRVLFYRAGKYHQARIDPTSLDVLEEATPVQLPIQKQYPHGSSRHALALGPDDMLVYVPDEGLFPPRRAVWFDRDGNATPVDDRAREIFAMDLAPDDRRLMTAEFSAGRFVLVLNDLARQTREPLRLAGSTFHPRWIPGQNRFSYSVLRRGNFDIFSARPDGSDERSMRQTDLDEELLGWFSDGERYLVTASGQGGADMYEFRVGESEPIAHLEHGTSETVSVSRDDRWVAFDAGGRGRQEVYVQRPTPGSARVRVSSRGGDAALFSPASDEIFFFRGDVVMAVDYTANGDNFEVGEERELFRVSGIRGFQGLTWAVSSDAQRFLILQPGAGTPSRPEIRVVYGW